MLIPIECPSLPHHNYVLYFAIYEGGRLLVGKKCHSHFSGRPGQRQLGWEQQYAIYCPKSSGILISFCILFLWGIAVWSVQSFRRLKSRMVQ
ncbi:hypothetical protein CPB86DRAFT_386777 [Serendipita vermifera]|nr:hypothetical protein CPB86DRAFT_386777 [Serendipita vermifera]